MNHEFFPIIEFSKPLNLNKCFVKLYLLNKIAKNINLKKLFIKLPIDNLKA